jgi:hypothetical protein
MVVVYKQEAILILKVLRRADGTRVVLRQEHCVVVFSGNAVYVLEPSLFRTKTFLILGERSIFYSLRFQNFNSLRLIARVIVSFLVGAVGHGWGSEEGVRAGV